MVYKQTIAAPSIIYCCASSTDDLVLYYYTHDATAAAGSYYSATAAGDYTSAIPLRYKRSTTTIPFLALFQFRSSPEPVS